MLLDGLQLVRFGGSVFEGVVLSARGISGEEADQVGAWRGGVRVSCAGVGPKLVGALSARGVSHRRLLRDAAIVLVRICLTQACVETTRVIYGLGPAWHTTSRSSTKGSLHEAVPFLLQRTPQELTFLSLTPANLTWMTGEAGNDE